MFTHWSIHTIVCFHFIQSNEFRICLSSHFNPFKWTMVVSRSFQYFFPFDSNTLICLARIRNNDHQWRNERNRRGGREKKFICIHLDMHITHYLIFLSFFIYAYERRLGNIEARSQVVWFRSLSIHIKQERSMVSPCGGKTNI